jgi:crossover junction endodeoxyribonuclease RusA
MSRTAIVHGVVTDLAIFRGELPPTATTLTLPEPPSANRWWRMVTIRGSARMLVSKEARQYKEHVAQLGSRNMIAEGPVKLSIDWYRERKAGDLDKRIGVCLDALQGVLFTNDSQIVELVARRFDDKHNPRVVVTVEAL